MVVGVFFFVITGAVLLLRPITKRLGVYLEVLAEERRRAALQPPAPDRVDMTRLAATLERIEDRLAQVERNQDFTEKLLSEKPPGQLNKG